MTKDIFSNQYWEKAWEDDPNTQDKRMKRAGLGAIHRHQVLKSGQKTLIKILLLKKASTVRNGL